MLRKAIDKQTPEFLSNKIIPVVFAMDEGYLLPVCVALASLLHHKDESVYLDIYIMLPHLLPPDSRKKIDRLYQQFAGFKIHYVEMGDAFSDIVMSNERITVPTHYRLLAADILTQYDKCIYLDGDIIVMKDLWELFTTQMVENYVAGVKAPGYITEDGNPKLCRKIGIPSIEQYINAGVMLMNLDAIRRDNLTDRFLELSKKDFSSQDQDVINAACFGHIFHLPFHYNVMTKYYKQTELLNTVFGPEEVAFAKSNPTIIHYANREKPWKNPFVQFYDEWLTEYERNPIMGVFPDKMEMAENYLLEVCSRLNDTERRYKESQKALNAVKHSFSYRIGLVITWLPRKARGLFRAFRKH